MSSVSSVRSPNSMGRACSARAARHAPPVRPTTRTARVGRRAWECNGNLGAWLVRSGVGDWQQAYRHIGAGGKLPDNASHLRSLFSLGRSFCLFFALPGK